MRWNFEMTALRSAFEPEFIAEARAAALRAVEARSEFWDGVLAALPSQQETAPCRN